MPHEFDKQKWLSHLHQGQHGGVARPALGIRSFGGVAGPGGLVVVVMVAHETYGSWFHFLQLLPRGGRLPLALAEHWSSPMSLSLSTTGWSSRSYSPFPISSCFPQECT
jgi:hypothetical protein